MQFQKGLFFVSFTFGQTFGQLWNILQYNNQIGKRVNGKEAKKMRPAAAMLGAQAEIFASK
jgi:hypothetical protein